MTSQNLLVSTRVPQANASWGIFVAQRTIMRLQSPLQRSFIPTCYKRRGNNPEPQGCRPASFLPSSTLRLIPCCS
jgi:hypothetical protein